MSWEIRQGDCRELLAGVEAGSVDLLLTDIPYLISQKSGGLRRLDYGAWDHGGNPIEDVLECAALASSAAIFCHETQLSPLVVGLEERGFSTRCLAWLKPNPTVLNGQHLFLPALELAAWGKQPGAWWGGHCERNVFECVAPCGDDRVHPTQKPILLMQWIVRLCCPEGGLVLDPFAGSGSTGVACVNLGRDFLGFELDPGYCDLARRRLAGAQEPLLTV